MAKNQHIGTCPVCFAAHSVNTDGRLAFHGWREVGNRRQGSYGNAWHTGSCSGSNEIAFELSARATWRAVGGAQGQLEDLMLNPPDITEEQAKRDRKKGRELRAYQLHRRAVCDYIAMAVKQALAWKPGKLADRKLVEKQAADKKRAEREAEAAERKAKRDKKAARKTAREQAKAEALVKLAELFEAAEPGEAFSLYQLKKQTGAAEGTVYDFVHQVVMASKEPGTDAQVYVDWERCDEVDPRWSMMEHTIYKATGKLARIEPMSFEQWSKCEWRPTPEGMALVEK